MLEIRDIRKKYGKQVVLDGVNFTVNDGESVCIAGSNGCGKSTLLKIVAGVLKADSGSVVVNLDKTGKPDIGYVPQESPLIEELSVRDNLKFWYCAGSAKVEKLCREGSVGKLEIIPYIDKKVCKLSGGMKKRVSIACACGCNPDILVMDEPGASLDREFKAVIQDFVKAFTQKGGIVLFSSHEDAEITMADRIITLKDGIIVDTNH